LFFTLIRLFIIIILFTFAAVESIVFIHQGISKVQKYFCFLATFKTLYLVVLSILLTHTHIIYIGAKYIITFLLFARTQCVSYYLSTKGLC